jgi:hypothetical protein
VYAETPHGNGISLIAAVETLVPGGSAPIQETVVLQDVHDILLFCRVFQK